MQDQTDAAVRWFELCVRWGIAAHDELDDPATDPDLQSIAQDERFQLALTELRTQRAAPMKPAERIYCLLLYRQLSLWHALHAARSNTRLSVQQLRTI